MVLGAGGITGAAWMLGALQAIHDETGWDPASAEVISGTSAGAVAAAVVASGVSTESLLNMAEQPELLARQTAAATGRLPSGRRLPLAWPGSVALGLSGLTTVAPRRRASSLIGFAPRGWKPTDEIRGLIHQATRDGWPDSPRLLVNACDYRTGSRVTFGSDGDPPASLSDAVTASAAVPGWYRPVRIGGRDYIDGGLASFTNADVVAHHQPDVVLCLSPFSSSDRAGLRDTAALGTLRFAVGRRLRREAHGLRAGGAAVAIIEPSGDDLRCMGLNAMARGHARAVVATAYTSVVSRLASLLADIDLPTRHRPRRNRAA